MLRSVFDKIFIPLYLAGSVGFFAVLFVPQRTSELWTGGTTLSFILAWSLFYLLTFVAMLSHRIFPKRNDLPALIIPLYFLLSSIWSLQPGRTFVNASMLMLNALFVVYLHNRVKADKLPYVVMWTIVGLCGLSLLADVAGVEAIKYYDDHLRPTILGTTPIKGFFFHKIGAGCYSALAVLIALIVLKGITRLIVLCPLVLLNLLSGSSTGLALLASSLLIYTGIRTMLRFKFSKPTFFLTVIIFVVVSAAIFGIVLEYVLPLLDRDPTLTGRTYLWDWGMRISFEKPLTGWGYHGYNETTVACQDAAALPYFVVGMTPHFHNSYVQYLADAGWIFGILFIALHFYALVKWYGVALTDPSPAYVALICCLFFIMFWSFFGYVSGRYNDLAMMLVLYALACPVPNKLKQEKRAPLFTLPESLKGNADAALAR